MDSSVVFRDMLADSDLVRHSFDLRSASFDAKASAHLVGWLTQEFMLLRCAWFASAVANVRGREHFVAFMHPDGRLAHAVASTSPQYQSPLVGDGCDILGRRPLSEIHRQMKALAPNVEIVIGGLVEEIDFNGAEMSALLDLAASLPWTSRLVRRGPSPPDGGQLLEIAKRLGYRNAGIDFSERRASRPS
jgi:hypothetical protein